MGFANSLRRAMMADVPTVAIDQVSFTQNTSPLPDEFIAHRLGLIPLISGGIKTNMRETRDCGCDEGCSFCMVKLVLNVKCERDEALSVTTAHLDVVPPENSGDHDDLEGMMMLNQRPRDFGFPIGKNDPDTRPVIITKLGKGQEINIICKAYKGLSKHHGKWSPLSAVSYEYDPHNKLRHTSYWFEVDQKAEWPPMKSAQYEAEPEQDEPFDYNAKPGTFYLEAEGTGALPVRDVVRLGFEALEDKLAPMILDLQREVNKEEGREEEEEPVHLHGAQAAPLVTGFGAAGGGGGMNGGYAGGGQDYYATQGLNGEVNGYSGAGAGGYGAGAAAGAAGGQPYMNGNAGVYR